MLPSRVTFKEKHKLPPNSIQVFLSGQATEPLLYKELDVLLRSGLFRLSRALLGLSIALLFVRISSGICLDRKLFSDPFL